MGDEEILVLLLLTGTFEDGVIPLALSSCTSAIDAADFVADVPVEEKTPSSLDAVPLLALGGVLLIASVVASLTTAAGEGRLETGATVVTMPDGTLIDIGPWGVCTYIIC
jgi:hypothetical protein